ncbi:streptococcal hemagglutinin-like [Sycon ciliatum]|uniref:streptococcal hemagglutinin-like n=1 Tax=Sycon ciliatum TaxID=27933 RepID=UPI0031F7225B
MCLSRLDDIILSINGTAVSSLDHAVNIIRSSTQRSLQFEIQRPPAGVYINVVYAESSSASASAAAATTPTGGGGAAAASTANAGMQTSQSNASIGSASSAPATATGTTTGQAGSASSISAAIPMATSGNMAAAAKAARGGESPSQGRQMASSSATTPTTINVARARVLSDVDADEYEIPVPETFDMSPPRHDAPEMDLDSWAVVDGTGVSRPVMQIRSSRACPDVYDPDSGSLPKQTCPVPACPDPGWRETFPFSLSSEDRYLSVCVWAKLENSRNNLLIGYASIPLHDIAVECAAVNVGRHEQCYVLIPGIHLTANANRAALRAAGAIQPGKLPTSARTWYEREYSGDVRLVFSHLPLPASASASAAPTPSPPRSSAASPCSEPSSPPRPTGRRTSQATSSHTPEKPSKPNSDTSSSTSHSPPPTTAAATAAAATAAAMSSSHANRSGTPSPHGQASSSPITSTAAATSSSATMTSSAAMMTSSLSTMTSSMTSASIAGGDATSLLTRSEGAHVPTSSHGMRARASAMTSSMTSSASPAAAQHTGMLPSNPLPPNTSGNESEHVQRNGNDRSSPCPSPGPGFRDSPQPGDSNVRRKPASVLAQTYTNSPSSRHTPGSRRRSTVSHDFLAITIPVPTSCIICGKKIFKKRCQRCQGCMGAAHTECAISSNTAVCPRTPITEAYSSESDSDYGDDHGGTPAAMTTTSTSSSSATTGPASSSSSSTSSTASARYNSHEHFSSPSSSPTSELRDTDEALVSGSDAVVAAAAATAAAVSAVVAPGDDALSKDAALASFETDKLVRQAGRGMYGDLALEDRRDKLTEQIKRLQQEIDNEKMKQSELLHQRKQATVERHKTVINECISHSNNKLEALTLLMLQYLSGLHDCEEAADS